MVQKAARKVPAQKGKKAPVEPDPIKQADEQIIKIRDLTKAYEDVLEKQMQLLYRRIEVFIATSQIPLVHVVTVLDLLKTDALEQLKEGYFGKGK